MWRGSQRLCSDSLHGNTCSAVVAADVPTKTHLHVLLAAHTLTSILRIHRCRLCEHRAIKQRSAESSTSIQRQHVPRLQLSILCCLQVAIKKVLQDKRFKNRELQIMKMMDHCNVVQLKHCFYTTTEKDEVFLNLVLEFVPETVYRIGKHYSKNGQRMPTLFVKLYVYQVGNKVANWLRMPTFHVCLPHAERISNGQCMLILLSGCVCLPGKEQGLTSFLT